LKINGLKARLVFCWWRRAWFHEVRR